MENETQEQQVAPEGGTHDSDASRIKTEEAPKANPELRAHAERMEARAKSLEQRVMRAELEAIGLKDDEGLGLAITETYQGDFSDGDVARFAEEKYRHSGSQAPLPPSVTTAQRLEQVQAASIPVEPTPESNPVEAAEARLVSEDATRQDAIASIRQKTRAITTQELGQSQ